MRLSTMGAREPLRGTARLALLRLKSENLFFFFLFFLSLEDPSLESRVDARLRCSSNLLVPLQGRAACPSRAFLGTD